MHRGGRLGQVERVRDSAVVSVVMEGQPGSRAALEEGACDQTLSEMVSQQYGSESLLNLIQHAELLQMLKDHRKAFSEEPHDHGQTNWVQGNMDTGVDSPCCGTLRLLN